MPILCKHVILAVIVFLSCLQIQCGKSWIPVTRIVITGTIKSPVTESLDYRFNKDLFIPSFIDTVHIVDDKPIVHFRIEMSSDTFMTGYIHYAQHVISLFIEPGDSQHIAFDLAAFESTLTVSGQGSGNSLCYSKYRDIFLKDRNDIDEIMPTKATWQSHRAFVDSAQAELRKTVFNSQKGLKKSPLYLEYERAEDHFTYLYRISSFWMRHPDSNACRQIIDSVINAYPKFSPMALATTEYVSFLVLYIQYSLDSITYKQLTTSPPSTDKIDSLWKAMYPPRYYAYWQVSQSLLMTNTILRDRFVRENIYPAYTRYMQQKYAESLSSQQRDSLARIGRDMSDYTFVDTNGNQVSLRQFKGKVVFIDFWTSWCGACIGEIPSLTKLKRQFESQNVVFVGISADEDSTKWQTAVQKYKNPGYQLLVRKANKDILTKLLIKEFPTYLILDKSGKIVDPNAKRPSDPKIADDIRNLLL